MSEVRPIFKLKETPEDTLTQWARELNHLVEFLDNNGGYLTVYNSNELAWDRNLIANSEFTVKDDSDTTGTAAAGFIPRFWTISGTAVSVVDNPWLGARTLKISTSSNVTYTPDSITEATVNPQYSIANGNTQMQFTGHIKGGTFNIRAYDQTNSNWFNLTDIDLAKEGTTLSYSASSDFPRQIAFTFDATEFSEDCTDIRLYIENTDASEYVYVNAPQISHGTDNGEAQEYVPGRYNVATINGVSLERMHKITYAYASDSSWTASYGSGATWPVASPPIPTQFILESTCDVQGSIRIRFASGGPVDYYVIMSVINVSTYATPFTATYYGRTYNVEEVDFHKTFTAHDVPAGSYCVMIGISPLADTGISIGSSSSGTTTMSLSFVLGGEN